jgi:hypothetical protein
MRLQRKKVQVEEKIQVEEKTPKPQEIRKETPTPSEEELYQEHSPDFKQPQPEPVQTPEQKLVKRPANEQAKSPVLGGTKPGILPELSRAVVKKLQKKPKLKAVDIFPKLPVVQPAARLDLAAMSKEKIVFQRSGKGNEHKFTWVVEVGGTKYVVKAGKGYLTMQDHLVNTDLFNRLQINGVHAPSSAKLTDDFRTALIGQLDSKNPADSVFLQVLAPGTNAQIAAIAPGVGVDQIFDSDMQTRMKTAREKIGPSKDSNSAILALKAELEKGLSDSEKFQIKKKDAALMSKLADSIQRPQAIKDLQQLVAQGLLTKPGTTFTLSCIDALTRQSPVEFANQLGASLDYLQKAALAMSKGVTSKAGAYALGGMAVVDLICGMNDRILGDKYNGGNFLFDRAKSELWCVDNAKDPKLALSSKDDVKWQEWVVGLMEMAQGVVEGITDKGQDIGEHIHWAIYTRTTEDPREISQKVALDDIAAGDSADGINEAVTDTLQILQAVVDDNTNGLPKAERDRLQARLDFVNARIKFAAQLKLDPQFSEIPSAKNPWVGKKVGRIIVGKIFGRSDEEKEAETWKNEARNPDIDSKALETLDNKISNYLADNPNADQRVLKALFAARSERLLKSLTEKAAALAALPQDNKAWGDTLDPSIIEGIKKITDLWVAKLLEVGDKEGAAALQNAVTEFANALPGAKTGQ